MINIINKNKAYITNKGFTLAEVLITLGIIGVVAAMTLPTIVTKYQKKIFVTRLKQTYSILNQAISRAEADYGDTAYWDLTNYSSSQIFKTYIINYLNTINQQEQTQNGGLGIIYRTIAGIPENALMMMRSNSTVHTLTNGTQLITPNYKQQEYFEFIIDVNGNNSPNQFGKDVFLFTFDSKHKFFPAGRYNTTECQFPHEPNTDRDILKNGTCMKYACNKHSRGMWCGALIMLDGWEIKDDYPW